MCGREVLCSCLTPGEGKTSGGGPQRLEHCTHHIGRSKVACPRSVTQPVGRRPGHSPFTAPISLLQRSIETLMACQTLLMVPSIQCVMSSRDLWWNNPNINAASGGYTTENGRKEATRRRIYYCYAVINTGMAPHGARSSPRKIRVEGP